MNPFPKATYLPLDLQISILLRLPVKSLHRFRCVSKPWSSIIISRDFRNQHLDIASSTPPRHLLIAFQDFNNNKLLFVTLLTPTKTSSSCLVSYKDLNLLNVQGKNIYNATRGLICIGSRVNVGICNPSTRQLHVFPQTRYEDHLFYPRPKYFFGYDPVGDQYKVLAIDSRHRRAGHKIVVLGGGESWRHVPCVVCSHFVQTKGLYMKGSLYYGAELDIESPNNSILIRFDVRLETFSIIKVPSQLLPRGYVFKWRVDDWSPCNKTLINYRGKIGVVEYSCEDKGSFRLWVVEDEEKEEWSMNTFHLPQSVAHLDFKVMDTFCTGEICLVQEKLTDPFCLFYYNLEKNSIRSVTIEGLPMSELKQVREISVTVSDHFESFMLLEEI